MTERIHAAITRVLVLAVASSLGLVAASCQPPPVTGQAHPALRDHAITKVAVLPLRISPRVPSAQPGATTSPEVAATIVAHQLTEALAARGLAVIAPSDMGRVLAMAGEDAATVAVPVAARLAHSEFGADTVLIGTLTRWVERGGSARGAATPAAVGFVVSLRVAPTGQKLWNATFDERQKPLGENVLVTSQYPGGGTRWLTAEELARWGAGRLVAALSLPSE